MDEWREFSIGGNREEDRCGPGIKLMNAIVEQVQLPVKLTFINRSNKTVPGSTAVRKPDCVGADTNKPAGWERVQVVVEFKRHSRDDTIETDLQPPSYAHEVFGKQSNRRFVPGFTICGTRMRV